MERTEQDLQKEIFSIMAKKNMEKLQNAREDFLRFVKEQTEKEKRKDSL